MARLQSVPGVSALIACLALLLIWDALARAFAVSGLPPPWAALRPIINPLFMVIYPVPKAALMPLIMLWIGIGDMAKVLVIFLGVSLPVVYHAFQGARAVEEKMLWSAAAMGLSARARLLRIVLPAALPEIMVGARTGVVLALITMVTSEMIARQTGVGNIFFTALDMAQYDTVYAMIIVIGALGFACDWGFEAVRRMAVAWAEPTAIWCEGSAQATRTRRTASKPKSQKKPSAPMMMIMA